MKPETEEAIQRCLKFKGGRSRPDKSFPFILPLLGNLQSQYQDFPTIFDIGCGRGSAGLIIDAEFTTASRIKRKGRPGFTIMGVDINKDYFRTDMGIEYWEHFEADFLQVYDKWEVLQIYLFVDILEHFKKADAIRVVEYLKSARRVPAIIAAIPNAPKHWKQSPEFEAANPHEAHLYNWTNEEVERDLGLRFVGENDGVGVFAYGV